jgi:hypothetical protein
MSSIGTPLFQIGEEEQLHLGRADWKWSMRIVLSRPSCVTKFVRVFPIRISPFRTSPHWHDARHTK